MIFTQEMKDYLHYCRFQKELDSKTIKAYETDLNQLNQFVTELNTETMEEIDKEKITRFLLHIHSLYKQKTVKRKIASIKAFFHYLEDEERIEINPMHKVRTKFKEEIVLPKIIPRSMIEQLLEHLYDQQRSKEKSQWRKEIILRDIAVIELLFATGLRISELCHLKKEYFDLQSGTLCIQGKGGKERYLHVGSTDVLEILALYHECFQEKINQSGYFFVNRYGKPLSEQSARRMIHKYTEEMQTDMVITPHMFRHSFATYLMEADVNIRYIQKMLGHSSITTTQIYTYVAVEKEREILRAKHPRNSMRVGKIRKKG